jgi:tyrosine-protein phosphatase SIW14
MRLKGLIAVFMFWCSLSVAAGAGEVASCNEVPGATNSEHSVSVSGVPDFAQVTPTFYRGGQPTRQGFENLREMGIKVVVDLRGDRKSDRQLVHQLGIEYVAIPWHCPFPHDETFARFLTLMRANASRKVFVHCRLGDDRVGMMVAAYRMAEQGWTAEQAMKEMKASGFTASHHIICPGLASYERQFPKRFLTSPAFKSLRQSGPGQ